MAKHNQKSLTQRERQCRKVAREKAIRKSMHVVWARVRLGLLGFTAFLLVAGAAWEYASGGPSRTAAQVVQGVWHLTASAGFRVQTVYLDGRSRTSVKEVDAVMDIQKGQPILALDLEDLRENLEKIPTVKHASVERSLPSSLYVRLSERVPVALWQHEGALSLIDDEGAVMSDLDISNYRDLPLVIGKGAPQHVMEALELLVGQQVLASEVTAMVRVGDRRWNMLLKSGVEVKLPEKDAAQAWAKVATMAAEQKLLDRAVRSVDVRDGSRMYIRLAPQAVPENAPTRARAT